MCDRSAELEAPSQQDKAPQETGAEIEPTPTEESFSDISEITLKPPVSQSAQRPINDIEQNSKKKRSGVQLQRWLNETSRANLPISEILVKGTWKAGS